MLALANSILRRNVWMKDQTFWMRKQKELRKDKFDFFNNVRVKFLLTILLNPLLGRALTIHFTHDRERGGCINSSIVDDL